MAMLKIGRSKQKNYTKFTNPGKVMYTLSEAIHSESNKVKSQVYSDLMALVSQQLLRCSLFNMQGLMEILDL